MVGQRIVMNEFWKRDEDGVRTVVISFRTESPAGEVNEIQVTVVALIESFDADLPLGRKSDKLDDCKSGSAYDGIFLGMITSQQTRSVRFNWEDAKGDAAYTRVLVAKTGDDVTVEFETELLDVRNAEAA